jgi:hypothetical protein
MKVIYFLANVFINTFGITKPADSGRKPAAFFILALTVLAIAAASTAWLIVRNVMR